MVYHIEGDTIGAAWVQCIKTVLANGLAVTDDKGTIWEISPLYLHIVQPSEHDTIIEKFGDKNMLAFMIQNFEDVNPIHGWGYSYAERLYSTHYTNTISHVIRKLQQYPTTKSATISLLKPEEDQHHTPCITTIDFKVRQDSLCVHAFFRSQDIGKKMYADAIALLRLGNCIAQEVALSKVQLYFTVCSAHIYETDIPGMQRIVSHF